MKTVSQFLTIVIFLLGLGFVSCKDKSQHSDTKLDDSNNQNSTTIETKVIDLPSMAPKDFNYLIKNCDYIDYIFYDLPISISQSEKNAIMTNVNFMSQETVGTVSIACKPMGRKFYHVNGEIVMEANVYLDPVNGCYFYEFLENEKPISANKISKDGVNFYANVFKSSGIQN